MAVTGLRQGYPADRCAAGAAWGHSLTRAQFERGALFGLPQPWATLVALGIALVALPVLAYLLYLAVLLLYPLVTGKRIDWR